MSTFVHVAGRFENGRQVCTVCGSVLVTIWDEERVGIALWPPPFPEGRVDIYVDHGEASSWSSRKSGDPAPVDAAHSCE
jgi:hypothetical protein